MDLKVQMTPRGRPHFLDNKSMMTGFQNWTIIIFMGNNMRYYFG